MTMVSAFQSFMIQVTSHSQFKIKKDFDNSLEKTISPLCKKSVGLFTIFAKVKTVPYDLPIQWTSNTFNFATDHAGIGIFCLKQKINIGVHFYSTGTRENFGDFSFKLYFRLRKLYANKIMQRLLDREIGRRENWWLIRI